MGERERERDNKRECDGGRMRERDDEGTEDNEGLRRRREGSRFIVESKVFELVLVERRKTPNLHRGKKERSLVLGPSGSGELRVPTGGLKPLHKGRERRQMGKGLEGTGEILLSVSKC